MRPKIVICTLAAAAGLLAFMIWLPQPTGRTPRQTGGQDSPRTQDAEDTAGRPARTALSVPTQPDNSTARAAAVSPEELVEQLNELAQKNDPASLNVFLEALASPDSQVWQTALQAIVQLNDHAAVPGLQQAADQTRDTTEQSNILSAIAFLNLPDFGENHTAEQNLWRTNQVSKNRSPGAAPQVK